MAKNVFTDVRFDQEDHKLRAYDSDGKVIGEAALEADYVQESPGDFSRAYVKAEFTLLESLNATLLESLNGEGNTVGKDELSVLQEALSFSEREGLVSHAFRQKFNPPQVGSFEDRIPFDQRPWVHDVYEDFLLVRIGPVKYRVNYTMDDQQNVELDERSDWKKAELEVVVVEESYALEGVSGSTSIVEHGPLMALIEGEGLGTHEADIVLVQPGWGNPRDKHYYPPSVLKRDSHKFKGVPMYATNHRLEEQTPRNRVATIIESGERFTEIGAPIARIAVQKDWFWEDLRMLDKYGLLHTVHNSIMAQGKSVKGSVAGQAGNIVQEITEPRSVDFVNKAGAGGHVLSLVESMVEAGDLGILNAGYVLENRPDIVTAVLLSEQNELMAQIQENAEKSAQELSASKKLRKELLNMTEQNKNGSDAPTTKTAVEGMVEAFRILSNSEKFAGLTCLSREKVFEEVSAGIDKAEKLEDFVEAAISREVEYVAQIVKAVENVGSGQPTPSQVVGNGGTLKEDDSDPVELTEDERVAAIDAVIEKHG